MTQQQEDLENTTTISCAYIDSPPKQPKKVSALPKGCGQCDNRYKCFDTGPYHKETRIHTDLQQPEPIPLEHVQSSLTVIELQRVREELNKLNSTLADFHEDIALYLNLKVDELMEAKKERPRLNHILDTVLKDLKKGEERQREWQW